MAVVERENSSLPLYLPIVCQPGRDSIRQPSDCELVLPLTGCCQPAAYCYCCHFSVVSYDSISAYWNYATTEVFTKCALLLISSFSQTRRVSHICAHVFTHMHTELWRPSFFFSPHHTLWLCFSFCLPSSGSLSYSWAICLGKCCVRCVSNRTSSVPTVHLLIVS